MTEIFHAAVDMVAILTGIACVLSLFAIFFPQEW